MPRIAITGATGLLGTRITTALIARGDEVVILSRNPDAAARRFPAAARVVLWAPGVTGAWRDEVASSDAVLHLAGESIGGRRWSDTFKQQVLDSRSRGTREIAEAAAAAGSRVRSFVQSSGIGFYGDTGEREVDESAAPGADFLSKVCVAWEAGADVAAEAGIRTVALRLGVVLAREGGALARMVTPFRFGVGGPIGSGRQFFPWIHIDDAVGLFLHALDTPGLRGPVNAVAPELVRSREFARAIGAVLGRPAFLAVPAFVLRLVVGEFAEALLTGQRALPRRAGESGYRFTYPELRSALETVL